MLLVCIDSLKLKTQKGIPTRKHLRTGFVLLKGELPVLPTVYPLGAGE